MLTLLSFAILFGLATAISLPLNSRDEPPSYIFPGDAPYGIPTSNLSSILTCPYGPPNAASEAVLLVHGTGSTGQESYGDGYVPALHANGYVPCYVTLRPYPLTVPYSPTNTSKPAAQQAISNIHLPMSPTPCISSLPSLAATRYPPSAIPREVLTSNGR